MSKYYILKRNNPQMMWDYVCDLPKEKRQQVQKRLNECQPLLLIEKTQNKDNTEHYTNLWTINEGTPILWEQHTKKRIMYDYTGIVNPLIHFKGKVMTFDQYTNLKTI